MAVEPNPVRKHLTRLRDSDDVEARQMASALVALLDIAEADPFRKIPAHWIATTIGRHVMREYE